MSDAVSAIWTELKAQPQRTLLELFDDGERVSKLSGRIEWSGEDAFAEEAENEWTAGIQFDLSKTHLDDAMLTQFEKLAEAMDFSGKRAAMFGGGTSANAEYRRGKDRINISIITDSPMLSSSSNNFASPPGKLGFFSTTVNISSTTGASGSSNISIS